MGGNIRHANKGPDRRESECSDCSEKFTHGKFSHPTYCPDCREQRQSEADIITKVEIDRTSDCFKVEVSFVNTSDVKVKLPVQDIEDKLSGVLGYIRVVGESFASEDALVVRHDYGYKRLKPKSTRSYTFRWVEDRIEQQNKPTIKYQGEVGEDFRDDVSMSRGDPETEDELAVMFKPAEDCKEHLTDCYDSC